MHKTSDLMSRNQILGRLVQQFESHSSGVVTEVNYLAEQLTREELAGSTDTIAIYKVRSKYKEGKYIEAYSILQDALQSDPFNICLQAERTTFLNGVAYRIFELIKEEPHSALIDQLYKILEQEGAASAKIKVMSFFNEAPANLNDVGKILAAPVWRVLVSVKL